MSQAPDADEGTRRHRDLCDVFVKLGGSILDHDALSAALVPVFAQLAPRYRIVVLVGGGQAVKRIKANQTRHGHEFYKFWRGAGLFPEANAWLLASYSPCFTVAGCAAEISACHASGNVAVLAPTAAIVNSFYFLPDWLVTMDSIGLYFANHSGARRYVIVSDVDGIYDCEPGERLQGAPLPSLGLDELTRLRSSKVDRKFCDYYRRFALPTFIVNGRHPQRVEAAIAGMSTVGTEITPHASVTNIN